MSTTSEAFWSRYVRDKKTGTLGEGRYGSVCRAVDQVTGDTVAIKKIVMEDDDRGIPATAMRELSILDLLKDVPNVIQLRDVFYEIQARDVGVRRELNLVFDCLSCDMRKYILSQKKSSPLAVVKHLMEQLCNGLAAMHSRGLFHRDLKPHNILLDTTDASAPVLKIADLGLGRMHALPIQRLTHEVGSLHYRAPEILLGVQSYGHAVDTWSVGCIFAELLTRKTIFKGENEISQLMKIFERLGTPTRSSWPDSYKLKDWHEFPDWKENTLKEFFEKGIADNAFDLLSKLLVPDPSKRITVVEALQHPYFAEDPISKNDDEGTTEGDSTATSDADE